MPSVHELKAEAQEKLGYSFDDLRLLLDAITHKSFANEASPADKVKHNERLEFLGDAVLGLLVSESLMEAYPDVMEGELSRMRAALVNEQALGRAAEYLGLGKWLRLGRGEEQSGGRNKSSLLANLFEALLGAIFLDGGLEEARRVVTRIIGARISDVADGSRKFDPKSLLQERLQSQGKKPPEYDIVATAGPDHDRRYTVSVSSDGHELASGTGSNKKEAEQVAAQQALSQLESGSRSSLTRESGEK